MDRKSHNYLGLRQGAELETPHGTLGMRVCRGASLGLPFRASSLVPRTPLDPDIQRKRCDWGPDSSPTTCSPLPKLLRIPVPPPALERCQWCMETPEDTDLVEHLQSLKDLPGGFGLAFAGAAEEIIRLREERDGLQRALRAIMRVVINIHDHQAQRTAAEQARQERVEAMLAAAMGYELEIHEITSSAATSRRSQPQAPNG